jgi:mRNA interferase MazF
MKELEKVSEYFDYWNELKKELHLHRVRPYFKEREVWWASIGHNIGDEQNGKNEYHERPILIIKRFYKNMVFYLPLTTKIKKGNYYFRKKVNKKDGVVILTQGRVIDAKRLLRKIETMDEDTFQIIVKRYKDLL